ncbi:unnamed protein product [Prorocentrum cordatum]|uniref:Condensin complex subunit 2 n=1 Tax=Prorocentrum cordatum TaxID=2364126 RepID=A0ABN9RU18_9DINO|nr:unnamed protein product [Polarella glacialis]
MGKFKSMEEDAGQDLDKAVTSEHATNNIIGSQEDAAQAQVTDDPIADLQARLTLATEEQPTSIADALVKVVTNNRVFKSGCRMHVCCAEVLTPAMDLVAGVDDTLFSNPALDIITETAATAMSHSETPKALVDAGFKDAESLLGFVRLRGSYTQQFAKDLLSPAGGAGGGKELTAGDSDGSLSTVLIATHFSKLPQDEKVALAEAGGAARGEAEWRAHWRDALPGLAAGKKPPQILSLQPPPRRLKREKSKSGDPAPRSGASGGQVCPVGHAKVAKEPPFDPTFVAVETIAQIPAMASMGVDVNAAQAKLATWTWSLQNVNMPDFAGKLAVDLQRAPKHTSAFLLASMFQGPIDLYLNGGLASALQSDCILPAWMVAITEKQSDSNVQMTHVEYKGKTNDMGKIVRPTTEEEAEKANV